MTIRSRRRSAKWAYIRCAELDRDDRARAGLQCSAASCVSRVAAVLVDYQLIPVVCKATRDRAVITGWGHGVDAVSVDSLLALNASTQVHLGGPLIFGHGA
jgi:hypothetical protein